MSAFSNLPSARRAELMAAYRKRKSFDSSGSSGTPATSHSSLSGVSPARRVELMDAWRARKNANSPLAKENSTLYNPLAPLAGDDLRSAVKAAVDAQLNPQLAALDREQMKTEGVNSALTRRTGDYYAQYADAAKQGLAAQGSAQGSIQGVDPNVAAAFTNQASTISQVTGMQGQDAQQLLAAQFAQQMGDLTSRRSEVEASRGPKTLEALMGLRQQGFDNAAVGSQLDLKAQDQAQTAAHQAQTDSIAAARVNESARGHTITENHYTAQENAAFARDKAAASKDAYQRKHKIGPYAPGAAGGASGKDKFGNTAIARRRNQNAWNAGLAFVRNNKKLVGAADAVQVLQAAVPNLPYDIAIAIAEWSSNKGKLSAKNWKILRRLGIPVGAERRM